MLKSLASIAIYSAVRALLFLVGLIPVPVGYWLCDRVARVGYTLSRARRNRGLGNVRRAFPELSAAEHIAMVKASFRNIIRVGYELILAPRLLGPGTVHECAVVKGIEHVASAHSAGVGSVLVGSHFGNWEIAGAIMGLLGYPITAVARGMEDRRFDLLLKKLRELYGLKVIGIRGAVQKGRSLIAEGEKLYFTADQHAREGRIWIPFFGQPAAWTKTPASLARRLNVPLFIGFCRRVGPFRFDTVLLPPVLPDLELPVREDVARMTQSYVRHLEAHIRKYPGDYLWLIRRWRTPRDGDEFIGENGVYVRRADFDS